MAGQGCIGGANSIGWQHGTGVLLHGRGKSLLHLHSGEILRTDHVA